MDVPKGYALKGWQRPDPVLWHFAVAAPEGGFLPPRVSVEMLFAKFGPGRTSRLQTWDRAEQDPDGPHWIGVRSGIKMHTDPGYPRYTHQLVVYNDGWAVTGLDRMPAPLPPGTAFCCDTHSPHQVVRAPGLGPGLYYLAASMDAAEPLPREEVIGHLLGFVAKIREAAAAKPL